MTHIASYEVPQWPSDVTAALGLTALLWAISWPGGQVFLWSYERHYWPVQVPGDKNNVLNSQYQKSIQTRFPPKKWRKTHQPLKPASCVPSVCNELLGEFLWWNAKAVLSIAWAWDLGLVTPYLPDSQMRKTRHLLCCDTIIFQDISRYHFSMIFFFFGCTTNKISRACQSSIARKEVK